MVAYLRDGTDTTRVGEARRALADLPGVEAVGYVSKDSARVRAIASLSEIREVSADLEPNPFPASLEIRFLPGSRTSESRRYGGGSGGGLRFRGGCDLRRRMGRKDSFSFEGSGP